MRGCVLLILCGAALAQEPGAVPTRAIKVRELAIVPTKGDPLKAFLAAHELHKKGDLDGALKGYLAYLGNAQRKKLPDRYNRTAQARLAALRKGVAKRYAEAVKLYSADGKKGIAALQGLAERYPMLPEGVAARRFVHSDALLAALKAARQSKDAKVLEAAIKAYPDAIQRYEAKSTLIELGGPDLFLPGERVSKQKGDTGDDDGDDEDGEETTIEVGDG